MAPVVTQAWRIVIERKARASAATERDTRFPTELSAKVFARARFVEGCALRAVAADGTVVHARQMAAWLLGTPREQWPAHESDTFETRTA